MDLSTSVTAAVDDDLNNLNATELRLGLPGTHANEYQAEKLQKGNKRALSDDDEPTFAPQPKAQIVGWPPVRSYRKNTMQEKIVDTSESLLAKTAMKNNNNNYVKVSIDGEPFVRKMDLKLYKGYKELLKALDKITMFNFKLTKIGDFCETEGYMKKYSSNYEPIYEDKDGDWMLIGDVPWKMFLSTCKRLRIKRQSS